MQLQFAFLLGAALAGGSDNARTFILPHILEKEGGIAAVGYDFKGGQVIITKEEGGRHTPFFNGRMRVNASQNPQVLRLMKSSLNGEPVPTAACSLVRNGVATGAGAVASRISFDMGALDEVTCPEMDVAATEAGFFDISWRSKEMKFAGFVDFTKDQKEAVKADKMWLPSNFRIDLGSDLPTSRITKISAITMRVSGGDLDGDGRADVAVTSEIEIRLPVEDAEPYFRELSKTAAGAPTPRDMTIVYGDSDDMPFFAVSVSVVVSTAGFTDPFLGDTPTPGREVLVRFRAVSNPGVK